ncbi:MAG: hypothetical protein HY301_07110 [Verrucomicrobia bacterium]|nr:hypothetical protein [Verrucomicrobiota bacterium]
MKLADKFSLVVFALTLAGCRVPSPTDLNVEAPPLAALEWPHGLENGPMWLKPEEWKLLNDRFSNASSTALGSTEDILKIRQAVTEQNPREKQRVEELRWLSASLVMARVRAPEASYCFVLEKKKRAWGILARYLRWIA